MTNKRKIELLAPAKNADIGIEAINHGADAVYIGAPQFSARAASGNQIDDIERLVKHAHLYNARVYVALNTILTDDQLAVAEKLIWELYQVGVDALIVQDMGVTQLNIPPIPLHASTQADNRTVEKVKFLEQTGFTQVVLARELSLNQIKEISSVTNVTLEVFVHGALCVSFSGQCYLSYALSGRSANRGECAQYCRLPYNFIDSDGRVIERGKHLLSLKDMNQSDHLEDLLDAGASSLKIEGRLKDAAYVKNITALYRKKLDAILARRTEFIKASSGKVEFAFTPVPEKSFSRGFTNYYLNGRGKEQVISPDTPKSLGEYIGTVKEIGRNSFTIAGLITLNNGDGLCYMNENGEFEGFRVNRAEENRIFPAEMPALKPRMKLYRNYDHEFEKELAKKSADRRIKVEMKLSETETGFVLELCDEDGNRAATPIAQAKELAKTPQHDNLLRQLSKVGNTIFYVDQIDVEFTDNWFIPSSMLSEARRQAIEELTSMRVHSYKREVVELKSTTHAFPQRKLSYLGNVANIKARKFYQDHGVELVEQAFELDPLKGVPLMFTKHCIKYAYGMCAKHQQAKHDYKEPFFIEYKETRLRLEFDCRACEMKIYKHD